MEMEETHNFLEQNSKIGQKMKKWHTRRESNPQPPWSVARTLLPLFPRIHYIVACLFPQEMQVDLNHEIEHFTCTLSFDLGKKP